MAKKQFTKKADVPQNLKKDFEEVKAKLPEAKKKFARAKSNQYKL